MDDQYQSDEQREGVRKFNADFKRRYGRYPRVEGKRYTKKEDPRVPIRNKGRGRSR